MEILSPISENSTMVTESGSPADSTSAWSGRFLSVKRQARTTPNATEPATKERRPRSAVGMLSSSLRVNTLHPVFRVSEFEEVTEWQGSRRMRFGTKMRATRLAETCVRSAPKPQMESWQAREQSLLSVSRRSLRLELLDDYEFGLRWDDLIELETPFCQ